MEAIAQHFGAIQTAVQTQNAHNWHNCCCPPINDCHHKAGVVQNAQYAEDCAKHYCGEP